MRADIFGETVSFEVDGASSHQTYLGALLSLIIIAITLAFALKQKATLFHYEGTSYLEITKPYANTKTELDYKKTNFNLAFGITKNNWSSDPVNITDYLELKAMLRIWYPINSSDGNFNYALESRDLELKHCSA